MAQAVGHATGVFEEARFLSQTGPCGICGRQSGNGTFFSKYIGFTPVSIIPTMLHTR